MKRGLVLIICSGVLWGTAGVFVRLMTGYGLSTWQTTAMRIFISFVMIFFYCLIFHRSAFKLDIKKLLLYLGSGISLFATSGFYFAAIEQTSMSTAVVLMYIAPVPVMLFSIAFLSEKMTPKKLTATVLMLVGCALVSGIIEGFSASVWGILLGLLAGFSYAAYNVFTKIQMHQGCDPLSSTLYTFFFAGTMALLVCKPYELPALWQAAPLGTTLTALMLALFTCLLPYLLYTIALKQIPVGTAAALGILEPMSASLIGVFFYKEALSIWGFCGIVLILTSVVLLSATDKKRNNI